MNTHSAETYYKQGLHYLENGQWVEAIQAFKNVLQLNASFPQLEEAMRQAQKGLQAELAYKQDLFHHSKQQASEAPTISSSPRSQKTLLAQPLNQQIQSASYPQVWYFGLTISTILMIISIIIAGWFLSQQTTITHLPKSTTIPIPTATMTIQPATIIPLALAPKLDKVEFWIQNDIVKNNNYYLTLTQPTHLEAHFYDPTGQTIATDQVWCEWVIYPTSPNQLVGQIGDCVIDLKTEFKPINALITVVAYPKQQPQDLKNSVTQSIILTYEE